MDWMSELRNIKEVNEIKDYGLASLLKISRQAISQIMKGESDLSVIIKLKILLLNDNVTKENIETILSDEERKKKSKKGKT